MRLEVLALGVGGQGVQVLGRILAHLANRLGYYVVMTGTYGAEMRGGESMFKLVMARDKEEILYFEVEAPDYLIVLHDRALSYYPSLPPSKIAIVNDDLVKKKVPSREVIRVPVNKIASSLGLKPRANMILLGVFVARSQICDIKLAEEVLKEVVKRDIDENLKLLRGGYEYELRREA